MGAGRQGHGRGHLPVYLSHRRLFPGFFYALMYCVGGLSSSCRHHTPRHLGHPEAQTCFEIIAKMATYTNPVTPAQANDQDFAESAARSGRQGPVHA